MNAPPHPTPCAVPTERSGRKQKGASLAIRRAIDPWIYPLTASAARPRASGSTFARSFLMGGCCRCDQGVGKGQAIVSKDESSDVLARKQYTRMLAEHAGRPRTKQLQSALMTGYGEL